MIYCGNTDFDVKIGSFNKADSIKDRKVSFTTLSYSGFTDILNIEFTENGSDLSNPKITISADSSSKNRTEVSTLSNEIFSKRASRSSGGSIPIIYQVRVGVNYQVVESFDPEVDRECESSSGGKKKRKN